MAHQGGAVAMVQFIEAVGDPEGRDRPWESFLGAARARTRWRTAELAHEGEHIPLAAGVQQGGGLIEQQQLGPAGQGAGHGQPLLLAAAEAVDRPLLQAAQAHLP